MSKIPARRYGILSIVFAVLSLIVLPIIFGPLGIIFGIIAVLKGESKLGITGIVLSVVFATISTIIGMYFMGQLMMTSLT